MDTKPKPMTTTELVTSTGAVDFLHSQGRADMLKARAAVGRHIVLSGNKKLQGHWAALAAYIDISMVVMESAAPEEIKSAAMMKEIAALMASEEIR
jgi:hypothetical protein